MAIENLSHINFVDNFCRVPKVVNFTFNDDPRIKLIYREPKQVSAGKADKGELSFDEIIQITKLMSKLGSTKVQLNCQAIEGKIDVAHLISQLRKIEQIQVISLSTMGFDLAPNLSKLCEAGLEELTINVDTLRPGRYAKITGTELLPHVQMGIKAAMASGIEKISLSMVVMNGVNADELFEFVALVQDQNAEVQFREVIPFSQTGWIDKAIMPWEEILKNLNSQLPMISDTSTPCQAHRFRLVDHPGKVLLVPSLSETHCDTCSTIRFSTGGGIQSCQYSEPNFSLISAMRVNASQEELENITRTILLKKPQGRPTILELQTIAKR